MTNKNPALLALASAALIASILACNLQSEDTVGAAVAATQTEQAQLTSIAAGESEPITAEATEAPAEAPAEATSAPPTATATVVHVTTPGSPGSVDSFMTDRSSRASAPEGRALGDNFDTLLFERPFAADGMQYRPYLDITRAELSASGAWFYVIISLEEAPEPNAPAMYGVEIDIDKDGRGDWLIYGQTPPGSEWTAVNVRALRDGNNDVGEDQPLRSEDPPASGDGYEELVFDSGHGPDPDAAWIRIAPGAAAGVQIAFKQTLIGPPGQFMWGAWSDEGPQDPAQFDYNDRFTISEAGSPVSSSAYYPLNQLELVDNTCRWGYGFVPSPSDPGACYIPPTPTPTPVPPTATPTPTATRTPIILY